MQIGIFDSSNARCDYSFLKTLFEEKSCSCGIVTITDSTVFLASADIFDIVFIDVSINTAPNGFEVAKKFRNINKFAYIILYSDDLEYAGAGYDIGVFRYLSKPLTVVELDKVVYSILDEMNNGSIYRRRLSFKEGVNRVLVVTSELIWIHSDSTTRCRILQLHSNKQLIIREALCDIFERLPHDYFAYAHQQYIINMMHIKQVSKSVIVMSDDKVIPVGRKYSSELSKQVDKHLRNHTHYVV